MNRSRSWFVFILLSSSPFTYGMLGVAKQLLRRQIKPAINMNSRTFKPPRSFHTSTAPRDLKFFHIVPQKQRRMIQRFGKFDRELKPGLRLTIPFIEGARKVEWSRLTEKKEEPTREFYRTSSIDLRECVLELSKQMVITKDNSGMLINAVVYFEIVNAQKAVYGVQDLPFAIETLAQTTIRNIVGGMYLDQTLVSRPRINQELCSTLGGASDKWGVNITRVELKAVDPSDDITKAMEKQMTAEREARAIKLQADGEKEAAILIAEGAKRSAILKAEGDAAAIEYIAEANANARKIEAEGEKNYMESIKSMVKDPLKFILPFEYIKSLRKMTRHGDKTVVVPYDTAGMATMLKMAQEFIGSAEQK